MSKSRRVVICTGAPGNGRDDLLREVEERAGTSYFHLFEYIVEEARLDGTTLTKLNILDFYDSQPEKMEDYRKAAIERIKAEVDRRGGVNVV
ncbi:MAG: hypothetical protein V3V91_06750, partial [Thermoplasmata archaeon]